MFITTSFILLHKSTIKQLKENGIDSLSNLISCNLLVFLFVGIIGYLFLMTKHYTEILYKYEKLPKYGQFINQSIWEGK